MHLEIASLNPVKRDFASLNRLHTFASAYDSLFVNPLLSTAQAMIKATPTKKGISPKYPASDSLPHVKAKKIPIPKAVQTKPAFKVR